VDKVRELLARAAACGSSGDLPASKAALTEALPLLAPRPAAPEDPQRAVDQCQAARMALRVGDANLALRYATALLDQVAGTLRALQAPDPEAQVRANQLVLANQYARAFVPFVRSNASVERRSLTDLGAFLGRVAREIRPDLDTAGWSSWPYPDALAAEARDLAARAAVDLGRLLFDGPSGSERMGDAQALGVLALDIPGRAAQGRTSQLIAADAHCLIGRALLSAGDLLSVGDGALAAFEASLAIQERFGTPPDLAVDRSNLATVCMRLAAFDQAHADAEAARARRAAAEAKGQIRDAAVEGARAARGRAGARLNRALELLRAAHDFYRDHPARQATGVLVNSAAAHARLGDLAAARADLVEARGLAVFFSQDLTPIHFQLGRVEADAGDLPAAERALADALPGRDRLARDDRLLLLGTYGDVLRKLGRVTEAFGFFASAAEEMQAVRRTSHNSRAAIALLKGFRWIDEALIACCVELGGPEHAARAFEVAEGLRWPLFVASTRYLAMDWRGPPDARLAEERALLRLIRSTDLGPPGVPVDPAIGAAFARLQQIWDGLAALDPDYVAIRRRGTVPADRVAGLLDDTVSALVAYYLGEEIEDLAVAWVFRRDGTGPKMVPLPCRPDVLAADVEQLRAATDATPPEAFKAAAARLHAALVAPIATFLPAQGGICFVPFGPMHNVPFGALFDGARHLVEQRPIVVAPSVTTLRCCRRQDARRRPRHSLLVAATGSMCLNGYVGADLSLFAALARDRLMPLLPDPLLIPKQQATKDRLLACLDQGAGGEVWDIVHVACHGLFETIRPDGTLAPEGLGARLILTGPGGGSDRDLTALEISTRVGARGALVVLCACESAIVVAATNDELFGLAHALMFAGAASVLASLWYVVQAHGVELTRRFYVNLLDAAQPMSRVEALRQAQMTTMRQKTWFGLCEGPVHPYVWSAFQLMGDWR
jgi:CHAT domain-containing protein/tetratricopeptide (TPR) repeat protein